MMNILLLFIPVFIFGLDFEFKSEYVYRLKPDEFHIKDGNLIIKRTFDKSQYQSNKGIITKDSKLVVDSNLRYYYHTNKFIDYREDLVELTILGDNYIATIKNNDSKNCFIVIKHSEQKTLRTKSNAMVLDLDALDSSNNSKAYFTCLKNKHYIF